MSGNSFDKFIKDKLENHSSAVPADMWSRIMPEKEPDKRGGYFKWAALVLIVAAVVCSGIYLAGNRLNNEKGATSTNITAAGKKESGELANPYSQETEKSKTPLQIEATTGEKQITANNIEPEERAANNKNVNIKRTNTSSSENRFLSYKKGDKTGIPKATFKTNHFNKVLYNAAQKSQREGLQSAAVASQQSLSTLNAAFNKIPFPISEEDKKARSTYSGKDLDEKLRNYKMLSLVDCPPSRNRRNQNVYVEFFVSPDYAMKTVVKGNGITDEYLRSKDSSESFRSAFTAGFRISKTMAENLVLKTGLQYSQINEKFHYQSPVEKRLVTVITIRTIIRGPNDTLRVSDTSTVEQAGYRVVKSFNRYHNVDIPIILSYEFGGENLKVSLNAGVILNLYSWQHGQVLDTSRTPVAFNKVTNGQFFKRNIGIGVYGGVSVIKRINEHLEAFAEPYFRHNLSSMTKDKYPFTQKFNLAGMNLGIRYKLSGLK